MKRQSKHVLVHLLLVSVALACLSIPERPQQKFTVTTAQHGPVTPAPTPTN